MLDVSLSAIQGDVELMDHLEMKDFLDRLDHQESLDQLRMICVVEVIIFFIRKYMDSLQNCYHQLRSCWQMYKNLYFLAQENSTS